MRSLKLILLLSSVSLFSPAFAQTSECNWTGTYSGPDGHIRIIQTGEKVVGEYTDGFDAPFLVNGRVNRKCEFTGDTRNPDDLEKHSEFWMDKSTKQVSAHWRQMGSSSEVKTRFEQKSNARPRFQYAHDPAILKNLRPSSPLSKAVLATTVTKPLMGQATNSCDWTGGYDTSYGILRLKQNGSAVVGDYGRSKIVKGRTTKDCRFTGVFQNPGAEKPEGQMTLTLTGDSFSGPWNYEGQTSTARWTGTRTTKTTKLFRIAEPNYQPFNATVKTGQNAALGGALPNYQLGHSAPNSAPAISRPAKTSVKVGTVMPPVNTAKQEPVLKTKRSSGGGVDIADGLARAQQEEDRRRARADHIQRKEEERQAELQAQLDKIDAEEEAERTKKRDEAEAFIHKTGIKLFAVCHQENETLNVEEFYGMAWVKGRVYNKNSGRVETLIPEDGFRSVSGDRERVWEIYPNSGQLDILSGDCDLISRTIGFSIDIRDYGYSDKQEFLTNKLNYLDFTVKLKEYDELSPDDELGVRREKFYFSDSGFKHSYTDYGCMEVTSRSSNGNNTTQTSTLNFECLARQKGGNGIFSGFRDGAISATFLFGYMN